MLWLVSVRPGRSMIEVAFDADGIGGEPVNHGSVEPLPG
jgi:hypothetical protein